MASEASVASIQVNVEGSGDVAIAVADHEGVNEDVNDDANEDIDVVEITEPRDCDGGALIRRAGSARPPQRAKRSECKWPSALGGERDEPMARAMHEAAAGDPRPESRKHVR